jgi:RNA polymerase sigma-70 factor (ECF subfamily)
MERDIGLAGSVPVRSREGHLFSGSSGEADLSLVFLGDWTILDPGAPAVSRSSLVENLVRRAQEGHKDAFAELVGLYRQRIEALAASRMAQSLRRKVSVEDVVQETIARAMESIGQFQWRGEDSFLWWLGAISRNVVARAARGRGLSLDLAIAGERGGSGPSPSRLARREERFGRLQDALRRLTPDQREAIRLSRIEGLKLREISERMGKTPDAVAQLIVRGLRSLRLAFGDTESLHLPDRALDFGAPPRGEKRGCP